LVDIPGSAATSTTVTVGGGSIINTLETVGDRDWFRVNLVAGQAITVTLLGVTLEDPYLRIRDSSGAVIYENDDIHLGVELDSQISFAAPSNGVYFIDVGSWNDQGTGDYQLNVTAYQTPPVYTNDQIAEQLVSGYWGDGEHPWNVAPGGSITVNLTALTAEGQALARAALQNWSQIIGINFSETGGAAQITFDDNESGAWTESQQNGQGFTTSAHINIDTAWLDDYTPNIGGYAYQAYLHEIGHALGLGHAGNYNTTANYPYDALFSNDAWSTSIMSYFSQSESTYFSNQNFTRLYVVTPMVADILAMQQLYGLSTTTRSGDTTYGFNSNAGTVYNAEAYSNRNVAMTIFDTGGNDTLDFSGYFLNQTINLNPETFSNIAGRVGNLSIARGSIIENAIGGFERDIIIGNAVANTLTGRDGNDTLTGGLGNDTFRDTAAGLSGDTITDFGAGDKIVITDAILAGFTFNLSGNTLTYTGGSLTLSGGVIGTVTASAAAGGGVQLSILGAIANDARNDFNGDGRSDVLWRNSLSGDVTNWLSQPNGGFVGNTQYAYNNSSSEWHIVGTGDFNGDGRDDILWRNDNGRVTNWLGNANGGFAGNIANAESHADNSWLVYPQDYMLV
jgi:serralysin